VRLPDGGYTRIWAKGLWALGGPTVSTVVGHRTGHKPYAKRWVEAVVKPREEGAYVHQHLKLHLVWEGPWKKGQGFKPDHGKSGCPAL
jgi:hypothetical protein